MVTDISWLRDKALETICILPEQFEVEIQMLSSWLINVCIYRYTLGPILQPKHYWEVKSFVDYVCLYICEWNPWTQIAKLQLLQYIFFWGKGQHSPQSPFLHSSVPPFLRSSPPVMLEDFKELRLWDIQEVLCNNKVTVIESSKVGHQGGDWVHSAYSQDVSEKSHQLTRCSFSLQKWIPLHSTCQGSKFMKHPVKTLSMIEPSFHPHLVEGVVKWQEGKRR